ncbi:MAG: hypothetical protein KY456_16615, partial [Chloroflexi bacterium]|nr:hypothetical protein [Chloroflexota bacterium]
MRHRTILSLALILGLVPALNTTPLFAMQDEQQAELCEDMVTVGEETFRLDCTDTPPGEFSEGLRVTAGPEAESADRLYAVQFIGEGEDESNPMEGAYIPERFNNQAMVVKVLDGQFAFRTQGPGVIVDAQDQPLERYTASIPIGLGENPNIQAANAGMTRSYYE